MIGFPQSLFSDATATPQRRHREDAVTYALAVRLRKAGMTVYRAGLDHLVASRRLSTRQLKEFAEIWLRQAQSQGS